PHQRSERILNRQILLALFHVEQLEMFDVVQSSQSHSFGHSLAGECRGIEKFTHRPEIGVLAEPNRERHTSSRKPPETISARTSATSAGGLPGATDPAPFIFPKIPPAVAVPSADASRCAVHAWPCMSIRKGCSL